MDPRNLRELDVKERRVLVRADLNVPLKDGKIADDRRIAAAVPTLRHILDRGGRPLVIAHLGRPGGEPDPASSSNQVADALGAALHAPVAFADDCIGETAESAAQSLDKGACLLLENLRFHPGERDNADDFADGLARLADLYVNDAFSVSHRGHASIAGIPGACLRLPDS